MVFLGIYRSDLQKQFKIRAPNLALFLAIFAVFQTMIFFSWELIFFFYHDDFGHKNDLQNIVKKGLDSALQGKKNSHFWPIL